MKNIEFKAVGKKGYDNFQWFQCFIDDLKGSKYKALNAEHARKMYEQISKIKQGGVVAVGSSLGS